MIDTLRLARRWKEAQNDPERMVEALADELDRETVSKTDLREFEARLLARFDVFHSEFESFKAGMQSEFESFKAGMQSEFESFKAGMQSEFESFRAGMQSEFESFKAGMQSEFESFKAEMRSDLEAFKAEVKGEMARFRNQVLAGQLAMFIALVSLIIYRTS